MNNFGVFQVPSIWREFENYKELTNFIGGSFTGSANWNFQLFDNLYRASWLSEKLCTVVADDMTDKWREFEHDNPQYVEARQDFEDENEIASIIREVIWQSRLYGGAAVFPIIKGNFDKLDQPFDLSSVKKNSLIGFHVLTKYDFAPAGGINRDILQPPRLFGDYLYYKLIRIQTAYSAGIGAGLTDVEPINDSGADSTPTIHTTRIIKFLGKELPYYQKFFCGGWGDSVLTPLLDKIPAIDEAFALLYLFFDEFNIDEYKIQGLANIVNNSSGDDLFKKYKSMRERMRDTKVRFVDANDTLNRNQLSSIAGLHSIFESMINYVVAATGIPISRLLGTSIKGFGTGENELVQYYDLIAQNQTKIKYQLRIIDEIIERHLFGKKVNIKYKFISKRELTEEQKAEIKNKNAATFASYVTARVMTPKIVAENIKNEFQGISQEYINSLEDDFISYQEDIAAITAEEENENAPKENSEKKDSSSSQNEKATSLKNSNLVEEMGEDCSGEISSADFISNQQDAIEKNVVGDEIEKN